jgi:two-component system, cell cycle sensor histidine kinase and response regulator CckA
MPDSKEALFEHDLVAAIRFDREGNILSVNRQACETYGYGEEEFRKLKIHDIDPLFPAAGWPGHVDEVPPGGALKIVRQNRRKDGTDFPALIFAHRPDAGSGAALVGFIPRHHRSGRNGDGSAPRAVHPGPRPDQVILSTREGAIRYVNDAACRTLGYDREELLRMSVFDINPMLQKLEDLEALRRKSAVEGGTPRESTHKAKDGRAYPVEMVITQLTFGGEEIHCAFIREISARKRSEEALRESELFLRKSQEVARLGSYRLDLALGNWTSSGVMDDIFGISGGYPKNLSGWMDLVAPGQKEKVFSNYESLLAGRCIRFEEEYRIRRPSDGEERWVRDVSEAELDPGGKPLRLTGTVQDITDRKRAEMEREALEEQLIQSNKMETVGRLAGGVAHEFNNMLAVILGYAELLRGRIREGDPMRRFVAEIEKAGGRARDVTSQLLAFSRKQIIVPRILNLNDQLSMMVKTLGGLIGEEVSLGFFSGEGLWNVRIDPTQLDQVLMNLAINARDAMPDGGRLNIETANVRVEKTHSLHGIDILPGDYVRISVKDEGTGMDKETLSHLFEPFFTTKGVGKGTGLGLATVYGIVKQNNGFIEADSAPGKGTTFRICLPRHAEGAECAETPDAAAEPAPPVSATSVLLVEDDEMVRAMLLRLLENLGCKVSCAASPHDAVDLCGSAGFPMDLLITDVAMPGMNGRELWEKVKPLRPEAKILFISGHTSDEMAKRGILEGDVPFLQKPFTKKGLAQAVKETMSRS